MKVDFSSNNSWKHNSQKLHRVILLQTVGNEEKKKTFIHSTQPTARRFLTSSVKTVSRASHLLLRKRCVAANAVRLGSLGGSYQFVIGISHWEPLTLVEFIFRKSLPPNHKTLNV
jgi:hypothetical protein